ncbi:hypothetical protein Tco_0075451, partial [Tanacetum coccineum]
TIKAHSDPVNKDLHMILPADHVSRAVISARLPVCIFPHSSFSMASFAAKYSIMTQEMVDSFCDSFYIPAEVHPTAPGRDKTITQFPVGKVVTVFRAFYTLTYSDGLFSFAKRSTSARLVTPPNLHSSIAQDMRTTTKRVF